MTLFVTGGTGFLGRRVVTEVLRRGHNVVCLVRGADRAGELERHVPSPHIRRLQFVVGELADARSCRAMLEPCDGVVHVAARLTGSASLLFASTVVATRTLVDAAVEKGVQRFVLVSSLGVYDTHRLPPNGTLDESTTLDPLPHLRDAYTYSKIEQERLAWDACNGLGLPLVVIRPAVVFGPGRTVLTNRIGLRIGPLMVRMGGARRAPCTYVDNCAAAVALAVDVPGIDGQAFNVVDDHLPTVDEVFRAYTSGVVPVPAVTVPQWAVPLVAGMCEWYSGRSRGQFPMVVTRYRSSAQWKPLRYSNERAKRVLGWRPFVPFPEALDRTIAALRRDTCANGPR